MNTKKLNIKSFATAGVFSAYALFSAASMANTSYDFTTASTLGDFFNNIDNGFLLEGYNLGTSLDTPQTIYSSYNWGFLGDSLVGNSALTNVRVTTTLYNSLASGGTVNLSLFSTQLNNIDTFLDSNFGTFLTFGSSNPLISFGSAIPFLGLTAEQAAILGDSKLNVTLQAIPEPETYAMMLLGLSLIGFTARRRQVA